MYTYILKKGGISLKSSNKSEYGAILTRIIKDKKITQQDFYSQLGIKKPYFYDIVSGKTNPPPPETQIKILKILNPKEEDKNKLLEVAAKERNEMPADILLYLKSDIDLIEEVRETKNYKKFIKKIINKGE